MGLGKCGFATEDEGIPESFFYFSSFFIYLSFVLKTAFHLLVQSVVSHQMRHFSFLSGPVVKKKQHPEEQKSTSRFVMGTEGDEPG